MYDLSVCRERVCLHPQISSCGATNDRTVAIDTGDISYDELLTMILGYDKGVERQAVVMDLPHNIDSLQDTEGR